MSYLVLNDGAAPATPAAGKTAIYSATGSRPRLIGANGADLLLAGQEFWNLLRNSGFWFAQRQVPGTLTTYTNVGGRIFTADGWAISNENASTQYRRVDTSGAAESGLPGRYYGEWTKITATGKIQIMQAIEGNDICQIRGRNVRLNLKLKAVTTNAQWNIALVQLTSAGTLDTIPSTAGTFFTAQGANGVDPTLGTNLSFIAPTTGKTGDNCTAGTNSYACSATTVWQRFSGVFTVPTTAKNLIVVVYSHNQVAAAAGIAIAEAMLTDAEIINDFGQMSYSAELSRCRRYYYKTFNVDQNPTTNVGVNTGEFQFMGTVVGAVAMAGIGFRYPVQMLKAGTTLTLFNPAAANAQVRNVTDGADMTGSAITANGEGGCRVNCTGAAGNAAGEHLAVHLSVDAEL
jgi:hypothetical protein